MRSADIHHAKRRTLQMKQTCIKSISLLLRTLKILAITVFFDMVSLMSVSGSMVGCSGGGQRLNVMRPAWDADDWDCVDRPNTVLSQPCLRVRSSSHWSERSQIPRGAVRLEARIYVPSVSGATETSVKMMWKAVRGNSPRVNYCIISVEVAQKDTDCE